MGKSEKKLGAHSTFKYMFLSSSELFNRIAYIATSKQLKPEVQNKLMHEVLVLTCAAGLKGTKDATGNLFAKVDVLCKQKKIKQLDAFDIQKMRHDSNSSTPLSHEDLLYDLRALALFVSKVFETDIPDILTDKIPHSRNPKASIKHVDYRCVRCIVRSVAEETFTAEIAQDANHKILTIDYSEPRFQYLKKILKEGVQVNLIDVTSPPALPCREGASANPTEISTKKNIINGEEVTTEIEKAKVSALGVSNASANESPLYILPCDKSAGEGGGRGCRFIIVSPDFLLDISSLAACFTQYGHSPLAYTLNRMRPMANSQAILLGNFAGSALDDIINKGDDYDWTETFKTNFREKALEYCTCTDLNQKTSFRQDAKEQVKNIREATDVLFGKWKDKEALPGMPTKEQEQVMHYSREKAILEPSFVCEQLGLQGRIDLMTTDLQLLVEQKSGKNFSVDSQRQGEHGSMLTEAHYVQLLLYYECLSRNFHLPYNAIDGRLLYSRYQMPGGLPRATYYRKLIDAALELRNQIVATEFFIAENGFSKLIPLLQPEALKHKEISDSFWSRWIYPQLSNITTPLQTMSPIVRSYFCHMADFVYREQIASQLGVVEGTGNSTADLWNMPLSEKKETGNIYTGLRIINKEQSSDYNGYDTLTLEVPNQGDDFLPNFRLGDSVYLYPYFEEQEPDVRKSLLFKGSLMEIRSNELVVHLFDGQQNPDIFEEAGKRNIPGEHPILWCIEHSSFGGGASAALRSLHQLISDNTGKRELLLAQREPKANKEISLSKEYHPTYDPIILKALQAQDYFLLVGPPGTGKTSMALQFMVRELTSSLLLMSYTNRAVDEICGMLTDNNIDYIRIGNEYTCDKRYRDHLLDYALKDYSKLDEIKEKILSTQVIVGTTATIQNRSYIFDLKHFDVAIVDEASQILEPNIVGLLTKPDKFILIGDYKQLPAVVQQDDNQSVVDDPELQAIGLQDCRNSLFERLIRIEKMNSRNDFIGVLNRQGRMHPEIAQFPNEEFYFDEHLQPVPLPHQEADKLDYTQPSEDDIDDLLKAHRMLFFPSADCRRPDISDKVNTSEAYIVAQLLRRIHRFYGNKFNASKTVGVIVPYRNQIAMIRKEIETLHIPELLDVSIDTVERYQGSQRDVIIYSFTIQNLYQLDFLTSNCFEENGRIIDRKLNVAITRARKQMLITGNESVLKNNQLFKKLIESIPAAPVLYRKPTEVL